MIFVQIIFGLVVGFLFGYILSRTGVTRYHHVMGMLLLKDFKILKFMLTAVTSSMILFYLLSDMGLLKLSPKALDWGKLVGGLIFGAGMGILGYCPGTLAARIGEGKKEAIIAGLGMAAGLFIYALTIKPVKGLLMANETSGDISFQLGVNHWVIVIPAAIIFSGIIYIVNKKFDDNAKLF